MNIILGKIGQKIVLNRQSSDAMRDNSNGNYGTYCLTRLLLECNVNDMFYIVTDNDFSHAQHSANVVDASSYSVDMLCDIGIDAVVVFAGLVDRQSDGGRFANIINSVGGRYVLLADDPRCLDSVANDCEKFVRVPDKILSGFVGWCKFKSEVLGADVHVQYAPLEKAMCYDSSPHFDSGAKCRDVVIAANSSDAKYNRARIVAKLTAGLDGVQVYGKLTHEEEMQIGIKKCRGVVTYDAMQAIFAEARSMVMIPIKQGWVTSKYMEALMNGVFPIFHKDYGMHIIRSEIADEKLANSIAVVEDKDGLKAVLNWVGENKSRAFRIALKLYEALAEPYLDGVLVSDAIMNVVRGVKERSVEHGSVE